MELQIDLQMESNLGLVMELIWVLQLHHMKDLNNESFMFHSIDINGVRKQNCNGIFRYLHT